MCVCISPEITLCVWKLWNRVYNSSIDFSILWMYSLILKMKFCSALGYFFFFKRWKNIKEFLIITRRYGMKQGIRQWFKSPSCCFNWIILLFWSGVWFAVLWLSVKLSCAVFALCQIYSRCCASGNQSTDLNSISIFS